MKVVLFCHSIISCWNNGHAHFLRGVARELVHLGHEVHVCEPQDGWSRSNLIKDHGTKALADAAALVPGIVVNTYCGNRTDIDRTTDGAGLVIVHEWTAPSLIAAIGRHRLAGGRYVLLFHDSHHRSVTAPADLDCLDLEGYDGILAFGEIIREVYLKRGWSRRVFTWHEAADTALFRPLLGEQKNKDLVWIGNWGDEERSRELQTFLVEPATSLGLRTRIHGVRYPDDISAGLARRAIEYAGWLPNHRAPLAYAQARLTVHVPRRPYCDLLPGIPTIRVFEALACGIPLVSSPWRDEEGLFPEGAYISAADGDSMRRSLALLLRDRGCAQEQAAIGLQAVLSRHTCAHRVEELLDITATVGGPFPAGPPRRRAPESLVTS